ncbi:hypothetical protein NP233_g8234 [Leucocoprinus birnbaumii]|uniref:Uncharacterized protein n=1 Tax=Leucocoprinus birnbaumii TaxID=56174 RepID=A0AAD5VNH2_9AGAR|nr:hypothetical protein NP233_g8234 [Leucocoprinus birnbaumii]
MLSVKASHLVGIFLEVLFYGIYLATCCFCIPTLFMKGSREDERWRRPSEIHWIMVTVFVLLFVICSFDVVIGYVHIFKAFIRSGDTEKALSSNSSWINIARSITQAAIPIVGDFLLIYRCWIVYGRRWAIILPSIILYLGGTVALSLRLIAVYVEMRQTPEGRALPIPLNYLTEPWWTALFLITAAQNILSSGILIWRIWRVERNMEKLFESETLSSGHPSKYLGRIIRVIAESGAIYASFLAVCAFLVLWRGNVGYLIANMALQSGGIVFNVIIARCSPQRDRQLATRNPSVGSIQFAHTLNTLE